MKLVRIFERTVVVCLLSLLSSFGYAQDDAIVPSGRDPVTFKTRLAITPYEDVVALIATAITELTGDVTAIGPGSAVATIANGAVTLAKMANIATDRLIGRDTAATGVPEALTVTGGLEFTGAGGIQRSALTGDVTASAGSGTTTLAAGSAANLNSGILLDARMPNLTGDVTTVEGAVATTIANDTVTYAKMQNVSATDKLLGRVSSGSGDVEEVTFTDSGQSFLALNASSGGIPVGTSTTTWSVLNGQNYKQTLIFNDQLTGYVQTGIPSIWAYKHSKAIQQNYGAATDINIGFPAAFTYTTSGSARASADDANGVFNTLITGAVTGNTSSYVSTTAVCQRRWTVDAAFKFVTRPSVANIRIWVGLFSATPAASATPAVHLAGFRYDTTADGTAFWRACTDDGGGAPTVSTTISAVTADTSYVFQVRADTTSIKYYIGNSNQIGTGAASIEHSTDMPTSTTGLFAGFYVTALSNSARGINIGRCEVQHN